MIDKFIQDINRFSFERGNKFLFDNCIWMELYGHPSQVNNSRGKSYSQAFKNILTVKAELFIDTHILSEYINRYARIQYEIDDPRHEVYSSFKYYRDSDDFKVAAKDIAFQVRTILRFCIPLNSGFSMDKFHSLVDEYENGLVDFNDQILAHICREQGITIITHDIDFLNHDVKILTANKRLLEAF